MVLDALAPLGKEYVEVLAEGLRSRRWCDRYENKGKRSGAFSSGSYGAPPYILMNYKQDVFADVYTLAHEAGHSMHSWFSQNSQLFQDYEYPIFLAEVASTFNEELLTHHLLRTTNDPKMRAYIINRQIDDLRGTLFRQTMFAEFERIIHAIEESGDALTLDVFKSEYHKLLEAYFAENFVHRSRAGSGMPAHPAFLSRVLRLQIRDRNFCRRGALAARLSGAAGKCRGLSEVLAFRRLEISARNIESRGCGHDNARAQSKARCSCSNAGSRIGSAAAVRLNNYHEFQSGLLKAERAAKAASACCEPRAQQPTRSAKRQALFAHIHTKIDFLRRKKLD